MTRKRVRKVQASGDSSTEMPSAIRILREVQSGALSPTAVPAEARRQCVEHLTAEGYSAAEIAEVFHVSQRTVFRDLQDIRAANAIEADPALAGAFAGEIVQHARQSSQRLRRIARERDCPHATKAEAERASWTVIRELIETLQRLGWLPTAAHEIRADLTYRVDATPSIDELDAAYRSLDRILDEVDVDGVRAGLEPIGEELARLRVGSRLQELGKVVDASGASVTGSTQKEDIS